MEYYIKTITHYIPKLFKFNCSLKKRPQILCLNNLTVSNFLDVRGRLFHNLQLLTAKDPVHTIPVRNCTGNKMSLYEPVHTIPIQFHAVLLFRSHDAVTITRN